MEREELNSGRDFISLQVQRICANYGLYGNVVFYEPSPVANSDRNRPYIVAGTDPSFSMGPLPKHIQPDEILRTIERNDDLFYPNFYAIDLSASRDSIQPIHDLVDYCKRAQIVSRLYGEYGMDPPQRLRLSEVNQLIHAAQVLDAPGPGGPAKEKVQKDLDWFFKRERSTGFRKRWLDYFRSGKFPTDKGPLAKIVGYFKRNNSRISMDQLTSGNDDLRKIEMQEFEYKFFQKFIKECYPNVCYAEGKKTVVDHGISSRSLKSSGRPVTGEEYAVVRKDKFASEGWGALAQLIPAYFEFRDVYYKAADEPFVASAYNTIVLQYAKCNDLASLKSRGQLCLQKIPASDFMNFVSLAKANNLRFYIDNLGEYATPSLETINVLYNKHQQGKMQGIVDRMIGDKVNYSHILNTPTHPPLVTRIQEIDGQKQDPPVICRENQRSTDSR